VLTWKIKREELSQDIEIRKRRNKWKRRGGTWLMIWLLVLII